MPRYNKERHDYGTEKERTLKTVLETLVGEPLTGTKNLYSLFDWESPSYCVELKSRTAKYSPEQFEKWLLPSCKADFQTEKQKVFFYYWEKGHRLFRLDYHPDAFNTYQRGEPWGSEQEHLFIPSSEWREVKIEVPV